MKYAKTTALSIAFLLPIAVSAGEATIINNVSSSVSSSGGGKAESNVKVYTEINGKTVENVDKTFESSDGNMKIEVNSESIAEPGLEPKTNTAININGKPDLEISADDEIASSSKTEDRNQAKAGATSSQKIKGGENFFRKILDYVFSLFKF